MIHDYPVNKRTKVKDEFFEGLVIEGIRDTHSLIELNKKKKTIFFLDKKKKSSNIIDVKITLFLIVVIFTLWNKVFLF